MPYLYTELSVSRFFPKFYLSNGYWKLELGDNSRYFKYFIIPDEVLKPTRVLIGSVNAVSYLQWGLAQEDLTEIPASWLNWLGDIIVRDVSATKLDQDIEILLLLCSHRILIIHMEICNLHTTEVRWCGRLISGYWWRFDSQNLQVLYGMEPLHKGAQPKKLIYAPKWIRTEIPKFASLIYFSLLYFYKKV